MPSLKRKEFLSCLEHEFGKLKKLGTSASLFIIRDKVRVYVRYSKVHNHGSTFFGLRQEDIALLEGFTSFIALLWDGQKEPLLIPYQQFSDVFQSVEPASDGQYKAHIYMSEEGTDLHIVRAGRFGVDSYFGLVELRAAVLERSDELLTVELSHHQIQTIVGAIGALTGHAVYIPTNDRPFLDWSIVDQFKLTNEVPSTGRHAPATSLSFIDVLWTHPTRNLLTAAFEVEHSTPIYSGLLRFNDVHIDFKLPRAGIIAQAERKEAFLRQINRRTFRASGLNEICLFYSYNDIYGWYQRLRSER
ncbi:MAG: hypothetical protein HY203_04525 [Nitrospirae bacterium]|nr:hypothetical protein [Nitrospirota bacterium]